MKFKNIFDLLKLSKDEQTTGTATKFYDEHKQAAKRICPGHQSICGKHQRTGARSNDSPNASSKIVHAINLNFLNIYFIRIKQRCGNVLNWKRVEGTNGKLQAFGFCEYDNPQFTLRCIRLLNGYEIAEKKLLVKVDQKTRELLGEYLRKNRRDDKAPLTKNAKKAASFRNIPNKNARNNEDGEIDDEEAIDNKNINLELVDEDTLKEDRITIGALELILKQYSKDLNPPEVVPPAPEAESLTAPGAVPAAPAESTESASSPSTGVYMKPHLVIYILKSIIFANSN